jgi:DNA-binding PadR family transcriptional regulator
MSNPDAGSAEPESFLPLTPAMFHILMVLAKGESHGYAIMQDIETSTNGAFRIGPGTLYGSIKRLLASGWIAEVDERPDPDLDDERRRYYRLTGLGRQVAEAEAQRLAGTVRLARAAQLLGGAPIVGQGRTT